MVPLVKYKCTLGWFLLTRSRLMAVERLSSSEIFSVHSMAFVILILAAILRCPPERYAGFWLVAAAFPRLDLPRRFTSLMFLLSIVMFTWKEGESMTTVLSPNSQPATDAEVLDVRSLEKMMR